MRRLVLAAALTSAFPALTLAQNVEVTPMAGYRFGGTLYSLSTIGGGATAFEVGDGSAFGVHLGYSFHEYEIEALYSRQKTNLQTGGLFTSAPVLDLALETWQAGGNYLIGKSRTKAVPFIGFAFGFTRLLPTAPAFSEETKFSASFAGGVKIWLGTHVGIRVEGRYFLTTGDGIALPSCGLDQHCEKNRDLDQGEARGGLILRF